IPPAAIRRPASRTTFESTWRTRATICAVNSDIDAFAKALEEATDRSRAVAAVEALLSSDAALVGSPPAELTAALIRGDATLDQPFLDLARAWSRPEMSRAMLDALAAAETVDEREQAAWLLKTVLAVEHAPEAIARVLDTRDDAQVRRWLVEALERLVFGGA